MEKGKFKVVEICVNQDKSFTKKVIGGVFNSAGKAQAKADKLNDKQTMASPNGEIRGYMVERA